MRLRSKTIGKDHWGALLLILIGAGVVGLGVTYKIGDLTRMGAGFVPVALGVLMLLTGIAIGVTAAPAGQEKMAHPLPGDSTHKGPEWRGWLCILGGVLAFVVFGEYGGLLPASFAAVFISAMGDRNSSVRNSAVLAALLTVFCLIVFHYGLSLQLPLFQWH